MAWRRPGDKPLSEPVMVILLTHICVTRAQWVKCITTGTWLSGKSFSQWQYSFILKAVQPLVKKLTTKLLNKDSAASFLRAALPLAKELATKLQTNGNTDFFWKLHCHWLKTLNICHIVWVRQISVAVLHIDGLVQERCNSHLLAMELCPSCINPSIWCFIQWKCSF